MAEKEQDTFMEDYKKKKEAYMGEALVRLCLILALVSLILGLVTNRPIMGAFAIAYAFWVVFSEMVSILSERCEKEGK